MVSIFEHHLRRHAAAIAGLDTIQFAITAAGQQIAACLQRGGKVLLCGNGGSAADAQHIAAELVGRYLAERPALSAIALTTDTSILTAVANDYGYEQVFARQIQALARQEDIFVGLSTSGNSASVIAAAEAARAAGCRTIGLLGRDGGQLLGLVDQPVVVPSEVTAHIQECHIVIGHIWCALVDDILLNGKAA
jgi:phosphoheptose isomerase